MSAIFQFPGMPSAPKKKDLANAVVTFVEKYRIAKSILEHEQLSYTDVENIVDGVRSLIYELEELKPPKK